MTGTEALVISSLISAAGAIGSGVSSMRASGAETDRMNTQARLMEQEAQIAAAQRAREVELFRGKQSISYMDAGVKLEGTPLQMLEETRRLGKQEIDALMTRGKMQSALMKQQAQMTRKAGRNAFFGSLLSAAGQGVSTYMTGQRLQLPGGGASYQPAQPLGPWYDINPRM